MLGKKNQGNGYWNLSSTRGLVSKFFGDGSSEIEKFFSRRVTHSSLSKHHTGTGLPGLDWTNSTGNGGYGRNWDRYWGQIGTMKTTDYLEE